MNCRDGESNLKILQHSAAFSFQRFDHGAALKIERKTSHLNFAFDRYASMDTVMLKVAYSFSRSFSTDTHREKTSV